MRKTPINRQPIKARLARQTARAILRIQLLWSEWMNKKWKAMSPLTRTLSLSGFSLLMAGVSLANLLGYLPSRPAKPITFEQRPAGHHLPSDSLILMEYLYKHHKLQSP